MSQCYQIERGNLSVGREGSQRVSSHADIRSFGGTCSNERTSNMKPTKLNSLSHDTELADTLRTFFASKLKCNRKKIFND